MLAAAALSATGLMHGYQWTPSDTVIRLGPAWEWVWAYGLMALVFLLAEWLTEPADQGHLPAPGRARRGSPSRYTQPGVDHRACGIDSAVAHKMTNPGHIQPQPDMTPSRQSGET